MFVVIEVLKSKSDLVVGLLEAKKIGDEFFVFIVDCKDSKFVLDSNDTELTFPTTLKQKSSSVEGIKKWSYEVAAISFKAIPCTLKQNDWVKVMRTMTGLQWKHTTGELNLQIKFWIQTSLAPKSRVVTRDLLQSGLKTGNSKIMFMFILEDKDVFKRAALLQVQMQQ